MFAPRWGAWGLPFLPRRVPMVAVVCEPVRVARTDAPTQAAIDAAFDRVAAELKAAFDGARGVVPGYS